MKVNNKRTTEIMYIDTHGVSRRYHIQNQQIKYTLNLLEISLVIVYHRSGKYNDGKIWEQHSLQTDELDTVRYEMMMLPREENGKTTTEDPMGVGASDDMMLKCLEKAY